MTATYGSLPFAEAIAFLRDKLDLPTKRWNDLWQSAHDRGFMVAGATKADLLADLHAAVLKAREQGTTLAEFRKDFEALVARHGWTGWTGEDTQAGRAWRTRTIYETNLRTSYQAGRWAQMTDPATLKWRPYWRYKHSDSVRVPRPHHLAWDGLVLRADDPWWRTHYPPNGWGCKCRAFAISKEDLRKLGKDGPDSTPDDGFYEWTDKKTGEIHLVPKGIDPGWDYAPGASVADGLRQKPASLPPKIASELIQDWLQSEAFTTWLNSPTGYWPMGIMPESGASAIGAKTRLAQLSAETAEKQAQHHPELRPEEYAFVQACLDRGEPIQDGPTSLIYLLDESGYVAVVKATKTGETIFVTSFRRVSDDDAKRDREIERLRGKAI